MISVIFSNQLISQNTSRWSLTNDDGIEWLVKKNDSHMDHIEMSGMYLSSIVHYGVKNGELEQSVHLVFPMLRTIPNDTHASLAHEINIKELGQIKIGGKVIIEEPDKFFIKGILGFQSTTTEGVKIEHVLFPSTDEPLFVDKIRIKNPTNQSISIEIPKIELSYNTDPNK